MLLASVFTFTNIYFVISDINVSTPYLYMAFYMDNVKTIEIKNNIELINLKGLNEN